MKQMIGQSFSKIVIGNATLYHGDTYELLPLIGKVAALVTDPPYEIKTSGGGKFRKQRSLMERIEAKGISKGFDHTIFKADLYGSVVTFCHNDQLFKIGAHLQSEYGQAVVCKWQKTNPIPFANRNYKADTEPYIHAWSKEFYPTGDPSELSRVITTPVIKSPYRKDHPTVKPDIVMNKIMRNVNGDTVLDPFMGTGSTGVAALRAGKKFIGIDHDLASFNIAVSRIFQLYGNGLEVF